MEIDHLNQKNVSDIYDICVFVVSGVHCTTQSLLEPETTT